MIMNPVIQGGGTLPEKVNIRYSSVVIYYMSESETGTFEIDNTTNAQSGTIEVFVGSPIFINGNLQRSSGIEKINVGSIGASNGLFKVIGEGEAIGGSGGGGMG